MERMLNMSVCKRSEYVCAGVLVCGCAGVCVLSVCVCVECVV
jgi:hypothetical protein